MRLKTWRGSRTLKEVSPILGVVESALSEIERGLAFPGIETIALIDGATGGQVTAEDHVAAWRRAHPQKFSELRARGRERAKSQRSRPKE